MRRIRPTARNFIIPDKARFALINVCCPLFARNKCSDITVGRHSCRENVKTYNKMIAKTNKYFSTRPNKWEEEGVSTLRSLAGKCEGRKTGLFYSSTETANRNEPERTPSSEWRWDTCKSSEQRNTGSSPKSTTNHQWKRGISTANTNTGRPNRKPVAETTLGNKSTETGRTIRNNNILNTNGNEIAYKVWRNGDPKQKTQSRQKTEFETAKQGTRAK